MGIELWQHGGGGGVTDQDLIDIQNIAGIRGDLIVKGASAWERLAIGASGTVLVGGTDPAWSASPTLTKVLAGTSGDNTAPAYSFQGATNYGLNYRSSGSMLELVYNSTQLFYANSASTIWWSAKLGLVSSSGSLAWGDGDMQLVRAGAGILEQRHDGVSAAQTFRTYGAYTDASNYVRASLTSNGTSSITLAAETAGTGADNIDVVLSPAGTGVVQYGTHSAIAAETVTGYITIKDAGGTTRKLAVVS